MRVSMRGLGLVVSLATLALPAAGQPVQGFVSAALLVSWCGSELDLDREACRSYLRGAFDTLQALRDGGTGNGEICIPPEAPINQLELAAMRFAAENPVVPNQQGAIFLVEAFESAFPCEAPVKP